MGGIQIHYLLFTDCRYYYKSDMQKDTIKPYFHYNCKSEAIIIDSQYTFQGNFLAACTSNAAILIYKSPIEQSALEDQDYNPVVEYNHPIRNNCFLKLAWSFYNSSILAAISINKEISYFQFNKTSLKPQRSIKCEAIPVFCCFFPSFQESVLSVGFSDGSIGLYNQNLELLSMVEAHDQSVNWLSWQRRLGASPRNKWISQYFPTYVNQELIKKPPLLASSSSDCSISIWKITDGNLVCLHRFKAHEKQIRQVMWKPNYFNSSNRRSIVSCSEDGFVKFWEVSESGNKIQEKMKSQRNFYGPVYRSEYNSLGTMIAISYYGGQQGKVETKAFLDKEGILGEQIDFIQ